MTQGFFPGHFGPKLLQFFVRKQPSMQLEAVGNVGATQPALVENANTTQTTASTKIIAVLLKWLAPFSCARPAVNFGKIVKTNLSATNCVYLPECNFVIQ